MVPREQDSTQRPLAVGKARAQMKDVAARAAASITTASNILNDTRAVAVATRDLVLRTMREQK